MSEKPHCKTCIEANETDTASTSGLPTEQGFYWWRETEGYGWRMVQVVDLGHGYLVSYDVQHNSWVGRSLKSWAEYSPVGQWIKVLPPKQEADQ